MNTSTKVALFVILAIGINIFAFNRLGAAKYSSGYDEGYGRGRREGYESAPKSNYLYETTLENQNKKLQDDYNQLVEDYNSLRDTATRYINASQYQARRPITCNTYDYQALSGSTTTCY